MTTNRYDAAGRLIQETDAVTGTVRYGYDAAGNTTAITTGDTLGNGIETVDPDGRDTTTQYDGDNRTTQSVDLTGTSTFTTTLGYDPDGNTLQTTVQTRSGTNPVQACTDTASYNAADWQTSVTDHHRTRVRLTDRAGRDQHRPLLMAHPVAGRQCLALSRGA